MFSILTAPDGPTDAAILPGLSPQSTYPTATTLTTVQRNTHRITAKWKRGFHVCLSAATARFLTATHHPRRGSGIVGRPEFLPPPPQPLELGTPPASPTTGFIPIHDTSEYSLLMTRSIGATSGTANLDDTESHSASLRYSRFRLSTFALAGLLRSTLPMPAPPFRNRFNHLSRLLCLLYCCCRCQYSHLAFFSIGAARAGRVPRTTQRPGRGISRPKNRFTNPMVAYYRLWPFLFVLRVAAKSLSALSWRLVQPRNYDRGLAGTDDQLIQMWSQLCGRHSVPDPASDPWLQFWVGRASDRLRGCDHIAGGLQLLLRLGLTVPEEAFQVITQPIASRPLHGGSRPVLPMHLVSISNTGALYLQGGLSLTRRLVFAPALDTLVVLHWPDLPVATLDHSVGVSGKVNAGYAGRPLLVSSSAVPAACARQREYARALASVTIAVLYLNYTSVRRSRVGLLQPPLLVHLAEVGDAYFGHARPLYLCESISTVHSLADLLKAEPSDQRLRICCQRSLSPVTPDLPGSRGSALTADSDRSAGPPAYGSSRAAEANLLAEVPPPIGGRISCRAFAYELGGAWRDLRQQRAYANHYNSGRLDETYSSPLFFNVNAGPRYLQVGETAWSLLDVPQHMNLPVLFRLVHRDICPATPICHLVTPPSGVLRFAIGMTSDSDSLAEMGAGDTSSPTAGGTAPVAKASASFTWSSNVLAEIIPYLAGRLASKQNLSPGEIASKWITQAFRSAGHVPDPNGQIFRSPSETSERYIGTVEIRLMVKPHSNAHPDAEGYDYVWWGTYHPSHQNGPGVDRTVATATGITMQYKSPSQDLYQDVPRPPHIPALVFQFFQHLPYHRRAQPGKRLTDNTYAQYRKDADERKSVIPLWENPSERIDPLSLRSVLVLFLTIQVNVLPTGEKCLFITFRGYLDPRVSPADQFLVLQWATPPDRQLPPGEACRVAAIFVLGRVIHNRKLLSRSNHVSCASTERASRGA